MKDERKEAIKQEIREEASRTKYFTTTSAFYFLSGYRDITLYEACQIITEMRGEDPYPFYE